ncbi:retropepsin-like aspartic protease family protein [Aliiglaciecola lipolytica]|uniref:retropepsin-like aspartic protease family protein n=1 Tax=Aliiglaciecola lipolytica TaxID=477689 RepID=UPI001C085CC0|nr:retropepsin-like aspartic protease [Aliiglaciecola lipolytica]MBU2879954.1 retroviral-like aspartic protease family protein [Aliiglaciecola lipolytica]
MSKYWAIFGLLCLGISVSLNVFFWHQLTSAESTANTNNRPQKQQPFSANNRNASSDPLLVSGSGTAEQQPLDQTINTNKNSQYQKAIYWIKQQLAAGELVDAKEAIQAYLRNQPQNIDYLLLEGQLIAKTASTSEVLAHYYGLLDLPLETEQKAQVLALITDLTNTNINKLKGIRSWDVLATFLEPLWQFDPTRRSIIVALAEAYAYQNQEFLMENVLASLQQGDLDAARIRQILGQQTTVINHSDPIQEKDPLAEDYERNIKLRSLGDHYTTPIMIGRSTHELMLDTGATTTVLTSEAFDKISRRTSWEYVGTYKINTAGGLFDAPVYQIKQVFFAGFRLDNVAVVVLPMPEFSYADGLLGMNILRQFDFKIDQQNDLLLLNRTSS